MPLFTFVTFVLCILLWTISWRILENYYNNHQIYSPLFIPKEKNRVDGVFSNDLENGLYYHNTHKLNNIKMLNKSQTHSPPIYYY